MLRFAATCGRQRNSGRTCKWFQEPFRTIRNTGNDDSCKPSFTALIWNWMRNTHVF